VPGVGSSHDGMIHMGLKYDPADTTTTSFADISVMQGYVTGPVWSGREGAKCLTGGACPSGAVCVMVDPKRFLESTYPYRAAENTDSSGDDRGVTRSISVPCQLVVGVESADGAADDPVKLGRIYWVYDLVMYDPVPPDSQV